jgi:hypothetical protein
MLKKKIYYVPGLFTLLGLPVLLLIWGPDDPVYETTMRMLLPSESGDKPGMVIYNREGINRRLRGKKIETVELDDLPSRISPDYTMYRKSGFVLRELSRLRFAHDTSEVLKVSFWEESTYGQFVWALNNANIFLYKYYFFLDDALYYMPQPLPVRDTSRNFITLNFGPDVVEATPAPRGQWELFREWAGLQWQEFVFMIRYSKLLAAGFVVLILCPGVAALIRRRRRTGIAPV